MASEIIMAIVGVFCAALSSGVTFMMTKRKYNTEVDSQQIQNMSDAFEMYKKMMEENLASQRRLMSVTIESQNEVIKTQNIKIEELQKENNALKKQVSELQMQLINFFGKKFRDSNVEIHED